MFTLKSPLIDAQKLVQITTTAGMTKEEINECDFSRWEQDRKPPTVTTLDQLLDEAINDSKLASTLLVTIYRPVTFEDIFDIDYREKFLRTVGSYPGLSTMIHFTFKNIPDHLDKTMAPV
jgi:hypothetical protein